MRLKMVKEKELNDLRLLGEEQIEQILKDKLNDPEEQEKYKEELLTAYLNINDVLKKYCDLKEEYYNIISLWIIGTYFHEFFPSFPYLYINATKGSGKTRLLKLVTFLSKDGELLNSLTEAVLFRSKGTLGIDEFEGISRKGNEALRELLNSAYKRGTRVKRMKKVKGEKGEEQTVEVFDVYRPIAIANIWGMEEVLGDRCISLVLERSPKNEITNLIEMFEYENIVTETKLILQNLSKKGTENKPNRCSLCRCSYYLELYKNWNNYVIGNYTNSTNTTNTTNYTNYTHLFEKLKFSHISGRDLELSFPLLLVSNEIGEIETTLSTLSKIVEERREEDVTENKDILLIDFVSQEKEGSGFDTIRSTLKNFKGFIQSDEDWINEKWLGRALKRLNLIVQKRRRSFGTEIILNITKAKEKIKIFKR